MRRVVSGLFLCLLLAACTVGIVRQEVLTPIVVTWTPIPMATGTPQPTSIVVTLTTPVPSLTPTSPPTHQSTALPPSPPPATATPAATVTPLVPSPPAVPVQHLFVSPSWPQSRTLFGLWGFAPARGRLYFSNDGGDTWEQPQQGLEGELIDLAVSPDYARDRTLLAGVAGWGVFKSTDGGKSWLPSNGGLLDMYVGQILFSPGYERDKTVFARSGELYRSTDGAATWQALGVKLNCVAISPEFDQDQTLMGISADADVVLQSRDGGDTWEYVSDVPDGATLSIRMLSIAPLFSKWQVVFAYSYYTWYHSVDGGRSWNDVHILAPPGSRYHVQRPQLVYGPEIGEGRVLFLQTTVYDNSTDPVSVRNILYYSEDAVNWRTVELPDDISPTAIAISPAFAQDRLLFVGTNDGRVIALDAATLVEGL
jgi:hypothetical protein